VHPPPSGPPIVDVSPLLDDENGPAAEACGAAIHRACLDTGFFVAVGHGLDVEMDELFDVARRFFALPQTAKEAVPRRDRYGFVPLRSQAIDTTRASDRTEYLDLGLHDEVDLSSLDGCRDAVRSYQTVALAVGAALLRVLAVQLGAPATFFAERMTDPQCRLRFLHYPPVEPDGDGLLPVPTAPHTDYGALTLLATDGVPGLEVRPIDGGWTPVVAPAGSLVVNLGDMLARWTNDVYRSTPHRVVGPHRGDRISIPFFVNPDPATVVRCIPSCVSAERPCAYEPIEAGAFLRSRIDSPAEPYVDPADSPRRRARG
jgi:isopenicillin N synthase-like dioxygenase